LCFSFPWKSPSSKPSSTFVNNLKKEHWCQKNLLWLEAYIPTQQTFVLTSFTLYYTLVNMFLKYEIASWWAQKFAYTIGDAKTKNNNWTLENMNIKEK
jgi:hypothetical protein